MLIYNKGGWMCFEFADFWVLVRKNKIGAIIIKKLKESK